MAKTKTKLKHQHGVQLDFLHAFSTATLDSNIILFDSPELDEFISDWKKASYFILDLETAETQTGNGLDYRRGEIRLYQIMLPNDKCLIVDAYQFKNIDCFLNALKETSENPSVSLVAHNAIFDISWLMQKHSIVPVNVRDTRTMCQVVTAGIKTQRYSLSAVHNYLFGEELDKTNQTSNWNNPNLSVDQLNYAYGDVRATKSCFLRLCAMIKKFDSYPDVFGNPCERTLVEVAQIECNSIPAFAWMQVQGYPINKEEVETLISEYENAILDLYAPLQKKLGLPYSAHPPQLAKAIYDQYGIWLLRDKTAKELDEEDDAEEIKITELVLFGTVYPEIPKTHVLTTSSSNLFAHYLKTQEEDLLIISLTRSLKKLRDTLCSLRDSAAQNNGRAVTRFNPLGSTSSGRSTSSGDKSSTLIALNLQNLPNEVKHPLLDKYNLKPIRYCIQPTPGHKLSIQDLSSSHSRICAKLSGDSTLISTLDEKDPHLTGTVVLMNSITGSSLTLDEAKDRGGKKDAEINGYRALFKTFFYLSLNVGSPKRLLQVLNKDFQTSTLEIAEACASTFRQTFPKVVEWQKRLHAASTKTIVDVDVKLKSGKKYTTQYCQFRTPDGRLMHLKAFKATNFNGRIRRDSKGNPIYQSSPSECTSVCLISPEALLQKQSLIETMELQRSNNAFKLLNMVHDEVVLELKDNSAGFEAAKQVYQTIARNFQKELKDVPGSMIASNENIKNTLANNYSEK